MKLRNIISVICVMASAFTACVNEMPVDGPDVGQPGELSIVFAVGDAQTKATTASEGDYVYATDKEVQINNFHVVLFDASSNAVIKSESITAPAASLIANTEEWENGKKTYKVNFTDISVKDHPSIYAVVIANYSDKKDSNGQTLDFSSCTDFKGYQKVVKETAAFADTTTLMKVGKSANTQIAVNAVNKVVVPLTQLTARIDFKGVVVTDGSTTKTFSTKAGGVTETSDPVYSYLEKEAIADNSILTELQTAIKGVASDVTWEPKTETQYEGKSLYVFGVDYYTRWQDNALTYGGYYKVKYTRYSFSSPSYRDAYYDSRAILVSKTYTETRTASTTKSFLATKADGSTKQFIVEKVVYTGFNTQSDIAIFDNTKIENKESVPYTATDKKHEGNTPFSFYTYERPASSNTPVTLSITGYFTEEGGTPDPGPGPNPDPTPTTETYKVTEYGYILQSRGNGWPSEAPTSEELAALANDFVMVKKVEEKVTTKASTKGMVTKANASSKTYTLELSKYDFIKGNCYSLTGYISAIGFELQVKMAPWTSCEVEVGYDSDKYK